MSFFEKRAKLLGMSTETDQLEYDKVAHSTGEGDRYEESTLALVFLRCLREGLQFTLSSNDAAGGKFDDLVLSWTKEESPSASALFVQLKHKTSAKQTTIRRSSLMGQKQGDKKKNKANKKESKDFAIEVYHESYEERKNSLDGGNYALVLCTNLDLDKDAQSMFVRHSPESVPGVKLLDSGGCLYSLNPEDSDVKRLLEGDDQFIQHFYLFCSQSNSKSIKDKIHTELKQVLGADEICSKAMCEKLCSSLREWMNTENVCLTSKWKIWLDIVEAYVKEKVTSCNSLVTRIKYRCVETLKAHIEACNPAWVRPPGEEATALSATKLHQAVCGETHIMVSVTRLAELEEKILRCWGQFCRWLILVDDDERSSATVVRMGQLAGPNRRLVIVSYKKDDSFLDTCKSGDICDDSWKELVDIKIKLNTEQHLCRLRDLCNTKALKAVLDGKPEALVALSRLSGSVRMGQDLDPLPENHIPRQLTSRMRVGQEFLSSLGDKKMCIMDEVSYKTMTKKTALKNSIKFEELENYLSASNADWPLFVVTNNIDHSAVEMISSKYADIVVYVVSQADDGWLYVEEQSVELLEIVDGSNNQVIVEGKPGIGKSTILLDMARLVKERHPAWWILRIDLLKYSEIFDHCDSGVEAGKAVLIRSVYNEKHLAILEHSLLQHCLQEYPRIICMVDGFDEICPDYAGQCLEALKELSPRRGKLVVTTRPSVTGRLEAALGVLAHSLPAFSEDQLHRFHGWSRSETGVRPTDSIRDLLKIPLFSSMYAESLKSGIMVEDVVSLYEAFFRRKFERLFQEKWCDNLSTPGKRKNMEKARRNHEKQLGFLALSHLLPEIKVPSHARKSTVDREDLVKAGIIYQFIDKKPVFIHRTFAEHFLAKWCFLDVADSLRAKVYRKALSDNTLEFFIECFDRMASSDKPLLLAVLDGSESKVKSLVANGVDATDGDKWRRNALHLAAAYSRDSTLLRLLVQHLHVAKTISTGGSASGPAEGTRGTMAAEAVSELDVVASLVEGGRAVERADVVSRPTEASGAAGPWELEEMVGAVGRSQYVEVTAVLGAEDGLLNWTPLRYAAERQRWRAVVALLEVGAQLRHLGDFQRGRHSPEELWRIFKEKGFKALFDHILGKNESPMSSQVVEERQQNKRCLEIQVGVSILCTEMSKEQYRDIISGAIESRSIEVAKILGLEIVDWAKTFLTLELLRASSVSSQLCEGSQTTFHEAWLGSGAYHQRTTADGGIVLCDAAGRTLLHYVAISGAAEYVRLLIEFGADVNVQDNNGRAAIHFAVVAGNVGCTKSLLCGGADVSLKDKQGWTPLHFAAEIGRAQIVKLLLDSGADATVQDSERHTPLHLAAILGNAECVRLLADSLKNLELTDVTGCTALHRAAANGDYESLQHLLGAGAHCSPANETVGTPLHVAALQGNAECVRLLLRAKVDLRARVAGGLTALHLAAQVGNTDCVGHLLKAGADIQEKNDSGYTPLHLAVIRGSLVSVRLLLKKGADVNARDNMGQTPLHYAVLTGNAECVKLLLEAGAERLVQGLKGLTPLHLAAKLGNAECVRLLADSLKNLELTDVTGCTALHHAAANGDFESLQHLLGAGAHCSPANETVGTPLHVAAMEGNAEGVRLLLRAKADLRARVAGGLTALHLAAQKGNTDCVRHLLKAGADIQEKDDCGYTPLHLAVIRGSLVSVRLLLEKGADVNARDNKGQTPLHYAVFKSNAECVKLLLEAGADGLVRDLIGLTQLHLAAKLGNAECVRLLAYSVRNLELSVLSGSTALHLAVVSGNSDCVKHLLRAGAHVQQKDNSGNTALHLAALRGSPRSVRVLLKKGADVNVINNTGQTPLHYAALENKAGCVKLLLEAGADALAPDSDCHSPLDCAVIRQNAECVRLLVNARRGSHQ